MSSTISKVLIANRGEIAVRIIRALREMGIKSVAIYSEADKNSLHVKLADESICIGPANSKESYLDKVKIINTAILLNCDAIHPGFGFLSENPSFARLCEIYGIKFIGPSSKVMSMMGNKETSKRIARECNVPISPGSDGVVESISDLEKVAIEIGFPVIIKARSGGGGKGMRVVRDISELENAFLFAKREAESSFADSGVFVEKFIENPRHIEVQILADSYQNVVHLGTRDCSLQRRHQKIVEEAPATLDKKILDELCDYAVSLAKYTGYTNAGTVEFLVDGKNIYFMEMNTRIQVEHPVTEMVTGIDIVKEQIRIASQKKLSVVQDDIKISGHAIECRINAVDTENNFMPNTGTISSVQLPGGFGIRIDSAICDGFEVTPFYDSMIAKIISYGVDRDESIAKMKRALDEIKISGLKTNIDYNKNIISMDKFIENKLDTGLLEREV